MVKNLAEASRVMLKISGETLKGSKESGWDFDFMAQLAAKISAWVAAGKEVVLVLGAGNVFRGREVEGTGFDPMLADYAGILATVMNGVVFGEILEAGGQPTVVMTSLAVPRVVEEFQYKKAMKVLERKSVLLCAGGTGNPGFTTDSAAVQKAIELRCDVLVKATKVDGVYDSDPMKNPEAKRFARLTVAEALEIGVSVMDHSALAMAMDHGLPLFVCKIDDLDKIWEDEGLGTFVETE